MFVEGKKLRTYIEFMSPEEADIISRWSVHSTGNRLSRFAN